MSNPEEGGSSGQVPGRYKFKEMKVHSSDEWMAGATKKYRKVFDRYETTYLRVEISFFNKLFDEEEWEASIRSKCFFVNGSQKNELSNFEDNRIVLTDENIVLPGIRGGMPNQVITGGKEIMCGRLISMK